MCTVSGNAVVSGYRAEEFGIHSVSGTTTVDGISGKGSISVTSGTVNVSYAEWNGDLNVSLISGNVNVSLPEDSGVNLSVSGVSGMVKTDLGQERAISSTSAREPAENSAVQTSTSSPLPSPAAR